MADLRTRKMPVIAQDPQVRRDERILTTTVSVPWEDLQPGPIGHRVCVIDYDASTRKMYKPAMVDDDSVFAPKKDDELLSEPDFHARNVYALVMRTLARFEYALGRRVGWGFDAHQLKVVPHAFEEMNAFYSREAESLVFGYYQSEEGIAYTCLSHDIVVHETSHALLDGLRKRFMAPSSPDQAAFHEAFGDIVALLSVFSLGKVLLTLLEQKTPGAKPRKGLIHRDGVSRDALMNSVLLGLAEEMGTASGSARAGALRRSVTIKPDERILDQPAYKEAHNRGEILVAAVMRTFVEVWTERLKSLGTIRDDYLDLGRVAEEGATIAELMLTMAIRAIDYTPPIHIGFDDYLSALVTADSEIRPDDSRYELRQRLLGWFARYGIKPASGTSDGTWLSPDSPIEHHGVHFQSLQTDPIEMFSLLWTNRKSLKLDPSAYTRVASVRPSVRISPNDGLPLRETVAECIQYVKLEARDLGRIGLTPPAGMKPDKEVTLEGGSTLILDEYGRLKYDIHNRLPRRSDGERLAAAQDRLQYLWDHGAFDAGSSINARLATMHRRRAGLDGRNDRNEAW
jgi:hypothetical protein